MTDVTALTDDAIERELRALDGAKRTLKQRLEMAEAFRVRLVENEGRIEALKQEKLSRANAQEPSPEPIAVDKAIQWATAHGLDFADVPTPAEHRGALVPTDPAPPSTEPAPILIDDDPDSER